MRCPSGHVGPFKAIFIGLPEGAKWWFQCRYRDLDEPKENGFCDQRFPGPVGESVSLLVSPEVYTALEGGYNDLVSNLSGELLYKRRMREVGPMKGCTGHMQKCYEQGECTGHA
jgi:hypothetical protein